MKRKLIKCLVSIALLVVVPYTTTVFACGPFTLEAIFVYSVHPAYPLQRFASGEIGVVQPGYARSYLYVAYRHLNSSPFTSQQVEELTQLWKERLETAWSLGEEDWIKGWLTARQKVPGVSESPKFEVYRNREKPNEWETYLNCQKDAFDSAISTLDARIAKYGANTDSVRGWIEAQDQVFTNCSEGQHIPAPLAADADAVLRADRAYQISAANFYSGNFDEARHGFEAIAADNASPWQNIAPYLIARTLLRKASLGPAETRNDSLAQAETQLTKLLADRRLSSSHAAATRLLDLVRNRLHPKERLHELVQLLTTKGDSRSIKQNLWDYTVLLDPFLDTDSGEIKKDIDTDILSDDLTDWIATFQNGSADALQHALSKWQASHSTAWLIAALSKIDGKHPQASELISQALKVQSGSPAFPSSRFHAVRLLIESGRKAEARTLLDQLLKNSRANFDQSSWNLLVSSRMSLANNLSEFLTYAPRVPASFSWNDDGREIPTEGSELSDENKRLLGKALFDVDAADAINHKLPLSVLKEAAKDTTLPTHLRRDLVQAAWLRAVLLDDYKTADELAPILKSLVPEISSLLADFLSTPQPEAKRFSAIYAWLKFPGLEPVVDQGVSRDTPLNQQDIYRDNWWCSAVYPPAPEESEKLDARRAVTGANQDPSFLTAAEKSSATKELSALTNIGAAPNYLCRQAVAWATKNPNDPRAPEALHLAVNSTRHGCTDKETGRWSKAAFDLLHRRYPNSNWARKTPYWFKD